MEQDSTNNSEARRYFEWKRIHTKDPVPRPRCGAASVVVDRGLYIFGGCSDDAHFLDDFWYYSFDEKVWKEVKPLSDMKPGPRTRCSLAASVSEHAIYLFGGDREDEGEAHFLNDFWKFDIELQQWTCMHDDQPLANSGIQGPVPTGRVGGISFLHNGKFVLLGGSDAEDASDNNLYLNDLHIFDFSTSTWTEVKAKGVTVGPLGSPSWTKDSTHLYVHGGHLKNEGLQSDLFSLDLETYRWEQMPSFGTAPSPRYGHSCCLYGNCLYLFAGQTADPYYVDVASDMYVYHLETNHWVSINHNSADSPSGHAMFVMQAIENSIYVFGGCDDAGKCLNDFFRLRLRPTVPPSMLTRDLGSLVNNPELTDVCFIVESKEVHAHKNILVTRSAYFRAMLCGGMRESENKPIEFPDISHMVFVKVLEFIYTDKISEAPLSFEIGKQLLIASEMFQLDRLKSLCEGYVSRYISSQTVASILIFSHRHGAANLKDSAIDYILRNLSDQIVKDRLSELEAEPALLVELLRNESIASALRPNKRTRGD